MSPFDGIQWNILATGIVSPEGPAADLMGQIFLVSRWTGRVMRVDANGHTSELVFTGGKPQSIAFLKSGEMLLADAENRALQQVTRTGMLSNVANSVDGERFFGPNDLVIADEGIVYLTDPGLVFHGDGRVLRIDTLTGQTKVLADGLKWPNGITLTDDGRTLMVAESAMHLVLRYELLGDGKDLGSAEVFYQFDDHHPDGIAFDAVGNLLVAMSGSGTVAVVSPTGNLLASIPTGGTKCTNCVFGGDDFQTLYLTEDDQQALLSTRWPFSGQKRFSRSLSR